MCLLAEAGQNLRGTVGIILFTRALLTLPLLLGERPSFDGWYGVTALLKHVLCEGFSLQHGRIRNRVQDDVVMRAGEVEQPEAVYVLLVFRRRNDSMDGTLDVAASQEGDRIARVHGKCGVLGLDPLPLVMDGVADLQRCDGLTEEQGEATEICVGADPAIADCRVLLRGEFCVLHISEMIFAFHFVYVDVAEVVLGKLKGNREEGVKRIQNFRMKQPCEPFDLVYVLLYKLRVVMLKVPVELRNIVDLHAIPDTRLRVKDATASRNITIELALV